MNNKNSNYVTMDKYGISYDIKSWKMENTLELSAMFESINFYEPLVQEIQIIASATPGGYGKYGIPKENPGSNAWCRAVFCNDAIGPWVFRRTYKSIPECVKKGLFDCLYEISRPTQFKEAVLAKNAALINALKINDLSLYDKKKLEINGYEIMIRKINTK